MIEAVVAVALRAILASVVLGAVLSALVLVVTRRTALTAATRHALWTTAMIATAVMPLAGIAVSLIRATPAESAVAWQPAAQAGGSGLRSAQQPRYAQTWTNPPATKPVSYAKTVAASTPAVTAMRGAMVAIAGWTPRVTRALALGMVAVWALGAAIGMIGLAASVLRIRGLKRRSSPLDGTLADELPWLTASGAGREIYLRLSYEIETPVAVGFGRPVILIPTELAGEQGLATLEPLVLHEHAHLRRYDDWTNLVQRMIERVFWFNPIVWIVGRRIALEREIASDDAVVEKTGEAHAYANSLWRLAREMRMPEHAVVAPGALLTRKQIAVRIEQLLDANRGRLHRSPAAALITACAGIAAVAFVATSAPAIELPAYAGVAADAPHVATHVQARTAPWQQHTALKQHTALAAAHAAPASAPVHVASPIAPATKTKIVYVRLPASANSAGTKSHATTSSPVPPQTADAQVPAFVFPSAPKAPVDPAHAKKAPFSAQELAVIRAAGTGTAAASIALSKVHFNFDGVVSNVLSSTSTALAQADWDEDAHPHRLPPSGVKPSRELMSTCMGCSFPHADLRGFDFHGLTLKSDDFRGADLRGANFAGAKLIGVSLRDANLANSDLRGATMIGVELNGAILSGARVDDLSLTGVSLRKVTLTGVSIRSLLARCTGCDLSHMDLHGVDLHDVSLTGADLHLTDLHGANLRGAHLTGVDLSETNLAGADLTNAQLEGCDLRGIVLRDANTTGMNLIGSSLGG